MNLSKRFPLVTRELKLLIGFDEGLSLKECLPYVNFLRVDYKLQPVDDTAGVIETLEELTEAIENWVQLKESQPKDKPLVAKEAWSTP